MKRVLLPAALIAATLFATVGALCARIRAGQARARLDESVSKLQKTLAPHPDYLDGSGFHCDAECLRRDAEHIAMHEQMGDYASIGSNLRTLNDVTWTSSRDAYERVFACRWWFQLGSLSVAFGVTIPERHDAAICYGNGAPAGCVYFDGAAAP